MHKSLLDVILHLPGLLKTRKRLSVVIKKYILLLLLYSLTQPLYFTRVAANTYYLFIDVYIAVYRSLIVLKNAKTTLGCDLKFNRPGQISSR